MATWDARQQIRRLLDDEQGTIRREAETRIALCYPSPYRAAMSSLGYQTIYRLLNELDGFAADRAVLPDDVAAAQQSRAPLLTLERERPASEYPMLAFSVAYELELAGVIDCLALAGIPALAAERDHRHPLIIAGGPLTFSNPAPLAPFFAVICMGEGEELIAELAPKSDPPRR